MVKETKDKIITMFLDVLKRNDVKKEIKEVCSPIINLILVDIYPYIYISLVLVIISFLLHLGIFVLLLKKNILYKS
jgi:hypothetical protein